MSTAIDERVVAAKFDSSDFEKGVNKTLKKLDELKKSLDMKDTGKSIEEAAKKTEASTKSIGESVDKLSERLTTFTGMIKQKILSGIADEFASVFIKMAQSVKNFITGISTDQISVGLSKYEQMVTAVRTIAASGKATESGAYTAIEDLAEYSDQTSYSLSQMTDAMSKFVSAGTELDVAKKDVQGIANACANAGVNATDAARAFYNLSQAYSSGSLKYTDYRSLELLNMTTEKFKQQMLDAAVAAGTLKKVSEGTYQTINKTNKKVTGGKKVTEKNLSESLRYGFMDTNAMNKLFGETFYFSEKEWREIRDQYSTRDEAIAAAKKQYNEIAVESYLAAREARSFTDVINTLKDVVSTGWGTTFEHLFGKLSQATDFFTDLAEGGLADAIYKIGEYRNTILEFWNVMDVNGQGSGTALFQQTIKNITDALGQLLNTFLQILPGFNELNEDSDGTTNNLQNLGEKLFRISLSVRDFSKQILNAAENFNTFMNTTGDDGLTRIERIRKIFANLGSVLGVVGGLIRYSVVVIQKAFTAISPILDAIFMGFEKITEPIKTISSDKAVFDNITNSADNLVLVIDKLAEPIAVVAGIIGDIVAFIAQMSLDTLVMNIQFITDIIRVLTELITGNSSQSLKSGKTILDEIKDAFAGIKNACEQALGFVKNFFSSIIADLRNLFGLTDKANKENQNGGIFSNVINLFKTSEFINNAKKWIDQAIVDVGNFIKEIPSKLSKVGKNIFEAIDEFLFGKKVVGTQTVSNGMGTTQTVAFTKRYKTGFSAFLDTAIKDIKAWFNDLPKNISLLFGKVKGFFENVINAIDEFLFGKKITKSVLVTNSKGKKEIKTITSRQKTALSTALNNIINEIKKFITKIPEYIKKGIKGAGDIVSSIVGALFGKKEGSTESTDKTVEKAIEAPFKEINLQSILSTIADIGKEILNQIARIFTGSDDIEENKKWFLESIVGFFTNLWSNVKSFVGSVWNGIAASLFGKEVPVEEQGKVYEATKTIMDKAKTFLEDIWNKIKLSVSSVWNGIAASLFGKEVPVEEQDKVYEATKTIMDKAKTFLDDIWGWLINAGVNVWSGISKLFTGKEIDEAEKTSVVENVKKTFSKIFGEISDAIGALFYKETDLSIINGRSGKKFFEIVEGELTLSNPKAEAIKDKDKTAFEVFFEGIAEALANGFKNIWATVSYFVGNVWTGVSSVFTGKPIPPSEQNGISLKAQTITTSLATYFSHLWNTVSAFVGNVWKGVSSALFGKEIPENEKNAVTLKSQTITLKLVEFFKNIWNSVSFFIGNVWKGLSAGLFEKEIPSEEETSISTKVKTFAQEKIKPFFDNIWDWILETGINVYSGISKLFTGKEVDETEKKSIIESIKEFFNKIFKDIIDFFKGPEEIINPKLPHNAKSPIVNIIEGQFELSRNDEQKLSDVAKSPISMFFSRLTSKLSEAFKNAGPAILEALGSALDWVGQAFDYVVMALIGDEDANKTENQVEGAVKDNVDPAIKNAIKNIGEHIKTFIFETLPSLLGAIFGYFQVHGSEFFNKLFSSMKKTMKSEAKDVIGDDADKESESLEETATNLFDVINTIIEGLNGITGSGIVQAVVLVIALTQLIKAIGKIASLQGVAESATDVIKWATVFSIVTGIVAIINTVSEMASDIEHPEKMERFMQFVDSLKTLAIIIGAIVGIVNVKDVVSSIASLKQAQANLTNAKTALKGVKNAKKGLESTVTVINNGSNASEEVNDPLGIMGAFKSILTGLGIGVGVEFAGSAISDVIDQFAYSISDALDVLTTGVDQLLEEMFPYLEHLAESGKTISDAKENFLSIITMFSDVFVGFRDMYNEVNFGNRITTEAEAPKKYIEDLSKYIGFLVQVSIFMKNISSAVEEISTVNNVNENFDKLIELLDTKNENSSFWLFLETLIESTVNLINMYGNNMYINESLSDANQLTTSFTMVSTILSIFTEGISSNITEDKMKAFSDCIGLINDLADTLTKQVVFGKTAADLIIGNSKLGSLAREMERFSNHLSAFYTNVSSIPGFEESEVEKTNKKIESISRLTESMAVSAAMLNLNGFNTEYFSKFVTSLSNDASSLIVVMKNINTELEKQGITDEQLNKFSMFASSLNDLAGALMGISDYAAPELYQSAMKQPIESLWGMIEYASQDNSELIKALVGFVETMGQLIEAPEVSSAFSVFGNKYANELKTSIEDAFASDPTLRPVIHPVFEIDETEAQKVYSFLNPDSGMFNMADVLDWVVNTNYLTEERIANSVDTIANDLSELKSHVKGMVPATASDLAGAFSQMRIVTDTGALVGVLTDPIDEAIGRKIMFIERYVATT